jgi:hypothetical protein
VEKILETDSGVWAETRFAAIYEFEKTSVQVLLYYFTFAINLVPHMQVRSRINGKILETAHKLRISPLAIYEIHHGMFDSEPGKLKCGAHGRKGAVLQECSKTCHGRSGEISKKQNNSHK